eukprot:6184328-Pleurochrysis_carterae.AAC.1
MLPNRSNLRTDVRRLGESLFVPTGGELRIEASREPNLLDPHDAREGARGGEYGDARGDPVREASELAVCRPNGWFGRIERLRDAILGKGAAGRGATGKGGPTPSPSASAASSMSSSSLSEAYGLQRMLKGLAKGLFSRLFSRLFRALLGARGAGLKAIGEGEPSLRCRMSGGGVVWPIEASARGVAAVGCGGSGSAKAAKSNACEDGGDHCGGCC